ncbi:MAG: hypothetical protein FD180_3913 [Planctomycetota bacterium]|nr:MAG: hypothetical protein FD180_3913 [Planctomycetota bacterium]
MTRLRFLHAAAVLAGVAALFVSEPREAAPEGPPVSVPAVLNGCHLCHAEYVKEWADSYHGKAWTDEMYVAAKNATPKEKQATCNPCHAPNPTQGALGKAPTLRSKNQHEGVACIACHQIPSGKPDDIGTIVGPLPAEGMVKGHANKQDKTMGTDPRICISCHGTDKDHNQYDSWKGSQYEKDGESCQSCHMPEVKRAIYDKKGALPKDAHRHTMPGAHDPAMIRKAALIDALVAGGKLKVTVTNDGAGHNFPGGGEREVVLIVTVMGADGKEAAKYRETFDLRTKNNRIKPNEARVLEFEAKAATGTVKLKLLYKLLPEQDEAKAVVAAEKDVKF